MDKLLLGIWRCLLPLPSQLWERQLPKIAQNTYQGLSFMGEDHHRVRNFVVTEIPRLGKPISPAYLSQALDLPLERLVPILDDLERHMTFLFRNEQGEVAWAYPVTADQTPHRFTLNSNEQAHAA